LFREPVKPHEVLLKANPLTKPRTRRIGATSWINRDEKLARNAATEKGMDPG
jgi:hypothetical protein